MPEFNSTTTRQNNIYVWNTDRNRMASDYCTLLVPGRWQTTEIPNRQSQSASLCPVVNKYEAWFLGSDCAFLVPAVVHFFTLETICIVFVGRVNINRHSLYSIV